MEGERGVGRRNPYTYKSCIIENKNNFKKSYDIRNAGIPYQSDVCSPCYSTCDWIPVAVPRKMGNDGSSTWVAGIRVRHPDGFSLFQPRLASYLGSEQWMEVCLCVSLSLLLYLSIKQVHLKTRERENEKETLSCTTTGMNLEDICDTK